MWGTPRSGREERREIGMQSFEGVVTEINNVLVNVTIHVGTVS